MGNGPHSRAVLLFKAQCIPCTKAACVPSTHCALELLLSREADGALPGEVLRGGAGVLPSSWSPDPILKVCSVLALATSARSQAALCAASLPTVFCLLTWVARDLPWVLFVGSGLVQPLALEMASVHLSPHPSLTSAAFLCLPCPHSARSEGLGTDRTRPASAAEESHASFFFSVF